MLAAGKDSLEGSFCEALTLTLSQGERGSRR